MSLRSLSVLIVDDCTYMRMLVSAMLRGLGLRHIGEAGDGAEALAELRLTPYDVLITDLAMPTLDGIELARLLRTAKDSPAPRIPIIMMTAHSERARVLGARDAGVNEIVSKPLSAQTLIDRIIAVIDHPRGMVRSATYNGPCRRRRDDPRYRGPKRRDSDRTEEADTWDVEKAR